MEKKLIEKALEAKGNSYSPYSNFKVGAAVLTSDNNIYIGTNIENSSYSATICAERVAIYNAISSGAKNIVAIAIVGDKDHIYPCGICRQVMAEFNKDLIIIMGDSQNKFKVSNLEELLPHSFELDK